MTERDGPMTPKAFHALFDRIGERAKMPLVQCAARARGDHRNAPVKAKLLLRFA
jgi:hypothetical protein